MADEAEAQSAQAVVPLPVGRRVWAWGARRWQNARRDMLRLIAAIGQRWHHLSHRKQHWIEGIVIGLVIELVLGAIGGTSPLIGIKNIAMDATLRGGVALEAVRHSWLGHAPAPALSFIEVDEATWRDPLWGEPYRAPRQKVAQLIDYAFAHGAQIVAVDILVERSGQDSAADIAEDQALKATLARLAPDQTVIFSRSLRRPLQDMAGEGAHLAPLLAASLLDGVASRGNLISAIPEFQIDRDGQVRSWHLWQSVCVPDAPGAPTGQWRPLPSVQLAAIAAMKRAVADAPWSQRGFGHCVTDLAAVFARDLEGPEKADKAMSDWIAQAGLFEEHWVPKAEARETGASWRRFEPSSRIFYHSAYAPEDCIKGGIQRVSALSILAQALASKSGGVGDQACAPPDRLAPVVVIGQSADAVGDKWATPLGPMPGAHIIANAILSLWQQGPVEEPSWLFEKALMIVHVALVAGLFAWFSAGRAMIWGAVSIVALIGLNWVYLKFGIWIDYATPAVGIYLHRLEGQAKALFAKGGHGEHG